MLHTGPTIQTIKMSDAFYQDERSVYVLNVSKEITIISPNIETMELVVKTDKTKLILGIIGL